MSGSRWKVVAGDYKGKDIMMHGGVPYISTTLFSKGIKLSSDLVASYEVVDDETTKANPKKKQKLKPAILVSIDFVDGKRSLIQLNEDQYKALVKSCFR